MRDDTFLEFALDQLSRLDGLSTRPMFGGFGLYLRGKFFGIVFGERLYFKTSEATREGFREKGMKPFRPRSGQTLKNYYEVPPDILEEPDELADWAVRAAEVG